MGMYVELIFNAELKKDTPDEVIDTLKYMIDNDYDAPAPEPISSGKIEGRLFEHDYSSYPVLDPTCSLHFSKEDQKLTLYIRLVYNNNNNQIEHFLKWIKTYIRRGCDLHGQYACLIYDYKVEKLYYKNS